MPSDPLDGIKTKRGRVIYDREKKGFNLGDICRILKKANPEIVINSTLYNRLDWVDCAYLQAVRMAQSIVETYPDSKLAFQEVANPLFRALGGTTIEFGGGEFGGGGATR